MPVRVEHINEYIFSDTVPSQKTKSGSDEISEVNTGDIRLNIVQASC